MYNQLLNSSNLSQRLSKDTFLSRPEIDLGIISPEEFIKQYNGLRFQNSNRWIRLRGQFEPEAQAQKSLRIEFMVTSHNLKLSPFILNHKDYTNHKLENQLKFNDYIRTAIANEFEQKSL